MAENKKLSRVKGKRKTWFKVVAPRLFGEKEVGESYLASGEKAIGRKLKVNLRELTGNVKDQNIYLDLKITNLNGTTLRTTPIGYKLTAAFVKRLVRKNADRVDEFLILKTSDGCELILKILIITRNKVQRSVKTELRKQLKALFNEEVKKMTFDNFLSNLVNQKIQNGIKKKLHKVYPLKDISVRVLELKNDRRQKKVEAVVEKTETKPATPTVVTEPAKPVQESA